MDYTIFSEWLKKILASRKLTKSDLARQSGISASQITRIINLESAPSHDALIAIARALRLPPEEVFRAAGVLPAVPPHTEYEERLIYLVRQLSDADRNYVLESINLLIKTYKKEV